jgi:hypothetical protein
MILIYSQPIRALEHAKFRELIDIASRATNGVKFPGQKLTRGEIQRLFIEHLTKLKTQLNVNILVSLALVIFSLLYRVQLSKVKLA